MGGLKTGQHRDVRGNVATFGQHRDVPGSKFFNVVTLDNNVETFQRGAKSTSRRSKEVQNQRRDVGILLRDVPERVKINVATLGSHVATFQRGSK